MNESCCQIESVKGGAYDRSNNTVYPAKVSDFRLDRFEITVGRFRAFVEAYPASRPKPKDGAHPLIAGSGWDAAWDVNLPLNASSLRNSLFCDPSFATWTTVPGLNESRPQNCITWYEAFAFCAWDGGRLPTEAEWNYAAAGGAEQRDYPWGSALPNPARAVYGCMGDGSQGCSFSDILVVGAKPTGDGKYGQADLGGSVNEWILDGYADPYAYSCTDCANLQDTSTRVHRGGSWDLGAAILSAVARDSDAPSIRSKGLGARCARSP